MQLDIDIAGKLFPNLLTMIVQLAATGVLFFGFKRLLWKPTLAYLQKRSDYAEMQLRDAESASVMAMQHEETAQLLLHEATKEAQLLVERGKEEGKRVKEKIVTDGKAEADLKLQTALREMAYQKQQMQDSIQNEIINVAMLAAQKLIEDKIDEKEDRQQVQRFIQDIRN